MMYDVWVSESANIAGAFESEREALDALGHALRNHGSSHVSLLILETEDDRGACELIATGTARVHLVEDHLESPHRPTPTAKRP